MLLRTLAVAAAAATAGVAGRVATARQFLVIGGGSTTGIYHEVAVNVCQLVNEMLGDEGYTCSARSTLGSVFNVNAVRRGLLDFGVVQSDRNWQAYNGKAQWRGRPYKGLRSVFSIYPETVILVARADAGIKSVNDLRGKRVNIGNIGSGSRGNAEAVLQVYRLDKDNDMTAVGLEQHEANQALVEKKIDAFFYTVGNPWGEGVEIAKKTNIRMIPFDASAVKEVVATHPYCVASAVPGGIYLGVDKDVPTFAVKATLVTSDREPDAAVYNLVKTVFENLDRFRKAHAAFASLKPEEMLQGLSAPLHPGAIRYYKEKGLM